MNHCPRHQIHLLHLTLVITFLVAVSGPVFAGVPVAPNVVFVTSATGTGDLGSWPDADGGTVGLAAADSICRNLATTAPLANPNDFVAWLSDSSDDAYCRVHGLTGKVSANCDQGVLPVFAGPWIRTDGTPFAPTIDLLVMPNNVVYNPLWFDEYGQEVPQSQIFTGTFSTGVASSDLCSNVMGVDWTSEDGIGSVGTTYNTGGAWTYAYGGSCATASRLLCVQQGAGGPLPPFAQVGQLVFVTSVSGPGELGAWTQADPGSSGISAGDSICRNLAAAAGYEHYGIFHAWLSDGSINAADRFTGPGRWVRPDGVTVFESSSDLTTPHLLTAVNVTETGSYVTGGRVWTGTAVDGTAIGTDCGNWLIPTAGSDGEAGWPVTTSNGWTANITQTCNTANRLYCLAVADPVFADDFEDATTTAWSDTVP